ELNDFTFVLREIQRNIPTEGLTSNKGGGHYGFNALVCDESGICDVAIKPSRCGNANRQNLIAAFGFVPGKLDPYPVIQKPGIHPSLVGCDGFGFKVGIDLAV